MIGLERFPDKRAFMRYQTKLQTAWEQFMSGGSTVPDTSVVPFRIAESWKRSRSYGLDPLHYQSYVKMKTLNIKNREKRIMDDRIAAYWFDGLAKKYAFNATIFDAQGNNLALLPDESSDISFANEMILGTNAAALSLLENQPGCVLAQEHYSYFFHQRFCAAAPFHDPEKNVVGTVCISTLDFDIIYTLAEMVEEFAKLCTLIFALAHQSNRDEEESYRAILDNLANLTAPILQVDDKKKVDALSQRTQKLLSHSGKAAGRIYLSESRILGTPAQAGGQGDPDGGEHPVLEQSRPECSAEFSDIVGSAPRLVKCIRFAKQAALTDFPVVLNGESGSGKELFAQAIHNASPRREGPFVAINCGAIAPSLVESELFGYEEGSFTDADRRGKTGLLEQASGGTLFLDEVESMPLAVQSKLLRVLSSGKLTRVGATAELPVDLRVISASKIDLRSAAEQGRFREDFFYRISAVSLHIPPLRERREDIPRLIRHILNRWGWGDVQVMQEVVDTLCSYDWPGNVRELENVLTHACVFSHQGQITLESLPEELLRAGRFRRMSAFLKDRQLVTEDGSASMEEIESAIIRHALEKNGWVLKRTAQALHIDRKTLHSKIKRDPQLAALLDCHETQTAVEKN